MGEQLILTGIILTAMPLGEYDRRVVVLTRERGKITAFAKGARRPNSSLLAAANPFVFGRFFFYEGRSSYSMVQADVQNYFHELSADYEAACYASYFLELADYYTRENNDEFQMLKLLYASLKGLLNQKLDMKLVRYVFELKCMVVNGEYPEVFYCTVCHNQHPHAFLPGKNGLVCASCLSKAKGPYLKLQESTVYTLQFVISAPIEKLYSFTLSKETFKEFAAVVEKLRGLYIEKKNFKSLEILKSIQNYWLKL